MLTNSLVHARWKRNPLSIFSVSPSMHSRILSEWRYLNEKRTPEDSWGFPRQTNATIHLNSSQQVESSRAVPLLSLSRWGRGKPHEPALFDSWPGEQSRTNSLCQISVTVLFFLSGLFSLFPPLFPSKQSLAWNWTLCEMAALLTSRVIIYKIRVKSVEMVWLEKNVLWLDIRMSECLLQWGLSSIIHQEATRASA